MKDISPVRNSEGLIDMPSSAVKHQDDVSLCTGSDCLCKVRQSNGEDIHIDSNGEPVSGHLDDLSYALSLSKQPNDLKVAAFDGISCISALSQG